MRSYEEMRLDFYDQLAPIHHELYRNWAGSCESQCQQILPLLELRGSEEILDAACSIGTYSIPLAARGYRVVAFDVSANQIAQASTNARASIKGDALNFEVKDFLALTGTGEKKFDRVLLLDNAISHAMTKDTQVRVLAHLRSLIKPGGQLLLDLRKYGWDSIDKQPGTPAAIYVDNDVKRIVHQVWDWITHDVYQLHLHIVRLRNEETSSTHLTAFYRATPVQVLQRSMLEAGFSSVEVVSPEMSGYHQNILIGRT